MHAPGWLCAVTSGAVVGPWLLMRFAVVLCQVLFYSGMIS